MALRIVRLADIAAGIGTAGVKIAQGDIAQAVRQPRPVEHLLHGEFGFAVGIGGAGAVALQNRHMLRFAVGGCRGGKDDLVNAVRHHGIQQDFRSAQIVVVVFQRIGNALPHQRKGGEMNNSVDLLSFEQVIQKCTVVQVALIERSALRNCTPNRYSLLRQIPEFSL